MDSGSLHALLRSASAWELQGVRRKRKGSCGLTGKVRAEAEYEHVARS